MTIIRNKANPNSAKMQKNDMYKAIGEGRKLIGFENVRSGHIVSTWLANEWVTKRHS